MPKVHQDSSKYDSYAQVTAFAAVREEMDRVKTCIDAHVRNDMQIADLEPLLEHVTARTGKMIRPGSVRQGGKGGTGGQPTHSKGRAVRGRLHFATLLHDDVIDHSLQRRAQPTANAMWGNETAILLGDYLLTVVFNLCTELPTECARVVARTTSLVCRGELRQTLACADWDITVSQYLEIISDKSASFLEGCCRLGAMLAGGTPAEVEALARYGLHVGIAFQIADDLLDIWGDKVQIGKSTGSDIHKNKATLPVIRLLELSDTQEQDDLITSLESPTFDLTSLQACLLERGCLDYAREILDQHIDRAIKALAGLDESDTGRAFIELAHFLGHREV